MQQKHTSHQSANNLASSWYGLLSRT